MTVVEIVLIIIGFVCVCASFFVSRKSGGDVETWEGAENTASSVWTEKEEQMIRERITELIEESQTELVDATEDQMSRLCNEKIMAIDEFSKQLLEKIENNHQEVVFMYNMLNEKEKEMKKTMTEPVVKKEAPKEKKESRKENARVPVQKKQELPKQEPVKKVPVKQSTSKQSKNPENSPAMNIPGNVNLQIQKMYKEGKSILEISKALDIGQGEVKLVIALYGGKGR